MNKDGKLSGMFFSADDVEKAIISYEFGYYVYYLFFICGFTGYRSNLSVDRTIQT